MNATEIKDILELAALIAIAYNVGAKLGGMTKAVDQIAHAVEKWTGIPERVAVLESRVDGHDKLLEGIR